MLIQVTDVKNRWKYSQEGTFVRPRPIANSHIFIGSPCLSVLEQGRRRPRRCCGGRLRSLGRERQPRQVEWCNRDELGVFGNGLGREDC